MKRHASLLSPFVALSLVIAILPATAGEKQGKSAAGFWADSRDDFYHLSTCPRAHKPLGAQLVAGSEMDLLALGYYPDPACLPNRSIATRAGRLVRVESGAFGGALPPKAEEKSAGFPELPKNDTNSGGFPGLAPGDDKKPSEAKPEEPKPAAPTNPFGSTPNAPTAPAKPAPSTGGFPSPPNFGGQPGAGNDRPKNPGADSERKQTTGTRGGTPGNQPGGRTGQQGGRSTGRQQGGSTSRSQGGGTGRGSGGGRRRY